MVPSHTLPLFSLHHWNEQNTRGKTLTAIIRLQIVFVGLLKPDFNVTVQDNGEETAFGRSARCFDVSPRRCLLQSRICWKNCHRCRRDLKTARAGRQTLRLQKSDTVCRHTAGLCWSTAPRPGVVCLYRSFVRKHKIGRWIEWSSRGFVKSVLCLFYQSA